jgi:hypothetical protein
LRTRTRNSVPSGTRIRGPGMVAGPPSSANARTVTIVGSVASGARSLGSPFQCARRASRLSTNTPLRNLPAGRRLSFDITNPAESRACGLSASAHPLTPTIDASDATSARPARLVQTGKLNDIFDLRIIAANKYSLPTRTWRLLGQARDSGERGISHLQSLAVVPQNEQRYGACRRRGDRRARQR